jgi:hypothetical protein
VIRRFLSDLHRRLRELAGYGPDVPLYEESWSPWHVCDLCRGVYQHQHCEACHESYFALHNCPRAVVGTCADCGVTGILTPRYGNCPCGSTSVVERHIPAASETARMYAVRAHLAGMTEGRRRMRVVRGGRR